MSTSFGGVLLPNGESKTFHSDNGNKGFVYVTSYGAKRVYGERLWSHDKQTWVFAPSAGGKYAGLVQPTPVDAAELASV